MLKYKQIFHAPTDLFRVVNNDMARYLFAASTEIFAAAGKASSVEAKCSQCTNLELAVWNLESVQSAVHP